MSDATPTPESTPAAPAPVAEPQESKVYDEAYVKQLRQEAANHRIAKNEAVEAAKAEAQAAAQKLLADKDVAYTELQNELGKAWIELEKVYTAIEAKVPSDRVRAFAEILKGEDADSIKESAKSAKALFGDFSSHVPAFDPTQGSGGGEMPLNGDPILAALKKAVGA